MNLETTTMKYFLYARKSTESEDRQVASIDDQITEMKRIAEKKGLVIVDIITESKSAKKPGRTAFASMLSRIHDGEALGILTFKLNRLARNPIDGGQISWMLQQEVITHIQTYGSDYKPSDNVLLMQIEFGMATQFVKDLSVSVRRGMRLKAERGWYPASQLPAGYIRGNRSMFNQNEIIVDPSRFTTIQKLWECFATGQFSINDIRKKALHLGLRNKKGNPYCKNFFHRLFINEFYYGYFYWNDHDENSKRHKGKHPVMITQHQFERVQQILGQHSNPKFKSKEDFLFRGLLSCGECSRNITAQRKYQCICTTCKKKFSCKVNSYCPSCKTDISQMKNPSFVDQTYYHCTNSKKNCSQLPVNEKILHCQMLSLINSLSISETIYEYVSTLLNKEKQDKQSKNSNKTAMIKKDILSLERKLKRLTFLRAEEELSALEYGQYKNDIKSTIVEFENEIFSLENQTDYKIEKKVSFIEVAHNLIERYLKASFQLKRTLLSKLSSNLTLKDKTLYFSMEKGLYEILVSRKTYDKNKQGLEPKKSLTVKGDNLFFSSPVPFGTPKWTILEPKIIILDKKEILKTITITRLDSDSPLSEDVFNAAA